MSDINSEKSFPTPPGEPRRTPSRRVRHYGYITSVSMLVVMGQYKGVLPIFRDTLREYLDITIAQFGLLFSVGPLIGVVSVLFGGMFVDRLGAVRMIRYCLQGMALAFVLLALGGQSYLMFIVAVCLGALFAGPLHTAKAVYVSQLFPREKRRMLSLSLAMVSGGGILTPLVAEMLLSLGERVGTAAILHGPFLVGAALLMGGSMLYRDGTTFPRKRWKYTTTATTATTATSFSWRAFKLPLPVFWLVMLGTCHGAADTTLHVWMPKFLSSESFANHPIVPGVVLSAYALAYLVARSSLALVPADFARRTLLILPGLLGGAMLIAGILSRQFWLTAGGYVMGAFVWSNSYPALLAMMSQQDRRRFGTAIAWKGVITALLSAACIGLVGSIVDRIGEQHMWLVMLIPALGFLVVGLGGAVWIFFYDRTSRTPQRVSSANVADTDLQPRITPVED